MFIEFYTKDALVKHWVLDYVRNELTKMHVMYPAIFRAEVFFKELDSAEESKTCYISLPLFGDSIFVKRFGNTYLDVARDAIDALHNIIAEKVKLHQKVEDDVVSTVDV